MEHQDAVTVIARALDADGRIATAILFGSAARDACRPSSDIDVAVAASSPADGAALQADLLDTAGSLSLLVERDVQLVLLDGIAPTLGHKVLRDGRVLFDRAPERTAALRERILREYVDGEFHRRMAEAALNRRHESRHGGP